MREGMFPYYDGYAWPTRNWVWTAEGPALVYWYQGEYCLLAVRQIATQPAAPSLVAVASMVPEKQPDANLERTIARYYGLQQGIDDVHYYYNRIDLDGDDKLETFVLLSGPTLCGTGGCSAVILKQSGGVNGYRVVSNFMLVRAPIIVSGQKSNGWRDLIMEVSGGGAGAPAYHILHHTGSRYPSNPSAAPRVPAGAGVAGTALFADSADGSFPGIPLTSF
ncbi:hypothetical protein [Paenibacillus sp. MMS18-CY102]|uniref:hypothetical protein n=1 Tax=Paenibacillus sp. MMS18-CY102 TaxID=2682849 RepID=UPI001365FB13|nr:hypothetical protein [Paenibacillus sp. MMS18-CY102]MWC29641.1 hypothetical protein [Paenibacillus sp. MMS18-CY102]